jgi:hypothetical protein
MTFLTRLDKLGGARESVANTYLAPAFSVPWNTAKWDDNITPLRDESVRANDSVVQGLAQGPWSSTLEMEHLAYPDITGHWFRAIIGPDTVAAGVTTTLAANSSAGAATLSLTASVPASSIIQISDSGGANLEWVQLSTVSGSGPYTATVTTPGGTKFAHIAAGGAVLSQSTHVFTQVRTFATVWPTYSFTIDDGQEQLGFPGCVCSELAVKIDPKGWATVAPKFTGFPSASQSTFAYAASSVQPVAGWGWTVSNPAASTRGLTMDFTFKRACEVIQSSDGTQAPREIFAGALELDGAYKTVYDSAADMNLYKQYSQGVTTHLLTQPVATGGQSLQITMSKGGVTTSGADTGQPYLQLTQAVSGIANATDGGVVTATLKNFVAQQYLRARTRRPVPRGGAGLFRTSILPETEHSALSSGYKNPVIRIPFPADLASDCWVVIRNPRLVPAAELQALYAGSGEFAAAVQAAAEAGTEVDDDVLAGQGATQMYRLTARLIIGWRVWDPRVPVKLDDDGNLIEDEETVPRLLPKAPVTPELAGLLPQEVLFAITDEVGKANPQKQPPVQEAGTSRTS